MRVRVPVILAALALGALYPLQKWIDTRMPGETISEETLYLSSGRTVKRMSLGLDALMADIYWVRTVQYFGRKVIDSGEPLSASTAHLKLDLLAPLLKIIVSLDPQHIPAYRFGAIFLPERDVPAAISLLEHGIEANPNEWRLYQDLGYVHWQNGDYLKAAETYEKGSKIEGALWWMGDLAGFMRIRGGSREAAREVYLRYLDEDDPRIRRQALMRLKQLQSLDEREAITSLLARYRERLGSCPPDLRLLAPWLRTMGFRLDETGAPVDPDGFAYRLDSGQCRVLLARESTIPR